MNSKKPTGLEIWLHLVQSLRGYANQLRQMEPNFQIDRRRFLPGTMAKWANLLEGTANDFLTRATQGLATALLTFSKQHGVELEHNIQRSIAFLKTPR